MKATFIVGAEIVLWSGAVAFRREPLCTAGRHPRSSQSIVPEFDATSLWRAVGLVDEKPFEPDSSPPGTSHCPADSTKSGEEVLSASEDSAISMNRSSISHRRHHPRSRTRRRHRREQRLPLHWRLVPRGSRRLFRSAASLSLNRFVVSRPTRTLLWRYATTRVDTARSRRTSLLRCGGW